MNIILQRNDLYQTQFRTLHGLHCTLPFPQVSLNERTTVDTILNLSVDA